MSTFLFHALSFHLILQNKGVYIWFFLLLLFLFVVFSVFFVLKGYIFVPCLIRGDLSSFQFASIRQMLCRIRSFYFFISFLLSILLASHLRPVSLSEACVLEWKLHFSGYKLLGSRVCAIRWHDLDGRLGWYLCLWASPPSPRLSHGQSLHTKAWENEDPRVIH